LSSTERLADDPAAVLLSMALSRPRDALVAARALIATRPDPLAMSFARQAVGIVLRDAGRSAEAVHELRAAVRAAGVASAPERVADARASLGAALVMAGRTRPGLLELDAAAAVSVGKMRGRVLLRRAYALTSLGRHAEALLDVRLALSDIRAAGDRLWEARALNNRAMIHVARGALTRADADIRRAEALFREEGQALEEILCVHNRGLVAYCRGDLPGTLVVFAEAARRYEALGVSEPELAFDQ
jgi:tetratricopeptide (TPR) repeat protein